MTVPMHRDDVAPQRVEQGDIAHERRRLGAAAGAQRVGLSLFEVPPGRRQIPVHTHGDEEEIFYVLSGGGLSWQGGAACAVGSGDVVVHRPRGEPHTFLAGDDGLALLAFADGSDASTAYLPRAQRMFLAPRWLPVDGGHPFVAEGEAGALERPEPGPRPANVVSAGDVEPIARFGGERRRLGEAGGARAGLNHVAVRPGEAGAVLHCHSVEEELFYVLDGEGWLRLDDERHAVRAGDVIARPPATRVAHLLIAGDAGLTYLAYGTRAIGDDIYYPELGKVWLRGLGVTVDATPGSPIP